MKKKYLLLSIVATSIFASCSNDSVTEEFNNANGNTVEKFIERVEFTSAQDIEENETVTINYDTNNRVSSITDGYDTSFLVYEGDDLSTISGDGDPLDIDELYQSPYDVFETGDVQEYDNNGNPIIISVFNEDDYTGEVTEIIATISYDSKPNPYFHTLNAAGIIDVMDGVRFNFSMTPQSTEIIRARALFPLNNISGMVFKNPEGEIVSELKIDYAYDAQDYPTSATFTTEQDNETNIYAATYHYKN